MKYKEMLYSKNGLSTMALAKLFLGLKEGEKIPTVTELNDKIDLARGTIQNSIKMLQSQGAIRLESRGHLGTFLKHKDMRILLEFAGITSIVGVMPLPYSKRYEGFATGIIVAMENQYGMPVSMAYMRGAQNRISMLLSDRYDFAIISKFAALEMQKKKMDIQIVKSFGEYSYLSHHITVFHDASKKAIEDGMRVSIDKDSIDQSQLTMRICEGKKVTFVPLAYNQILEKTLNGEVDAAIWNEDEVTDKLVSINYQPVQLNDTADTEAVLVVDSNKKEMAMLLNDMIDIKTVLSNQKLVLDGKITPSY